MITIGQNYNLSDESSHSPLILVGITSTTLLTTHKRTLRVILTNLGPKDVFIKFQAAGVDDDLKGVILYKNSTADLMLAPNIYVGEICAITGVGTSSIYVVSY